MKAAQPENLPIYSSHNNCCLTLTVKNVQFSTFHCFPQKHSTENPRTAYRSSVTCYVNISQIYYIDFISVIFFCITVNSLRAILDCLLFYSCTSVRSALFHNCPPFSSTQKYSQSHAGFQKGCKKPQPRVRIKTEAQLLYRTSRVFLNLVLYVRTIFVHVEFLLVEVAFVDRIFLIRLWFLFGFNF